MVPKIRWATPGNAHHACALQTDERDIIDGGNAADGIPARIGIGRDERSVAGGVKGIFDAGWGCGATSEAGWSADR